MFLNFIKNSAYNNKYHLLRPSIWPFVTALNLGCSLLCVVLIFHYKTNFYLPVNYCFFFISFCLLFSIINWISDVIYEGTFESNKYVWFNNHGIHSVLVELFLLYGMFLFIVSEIFFFVSFFWSFFHAALSISTTLGCLWPPKGLEIINPWKLPLINTVILLSSGFTLTISHTFLGNLQIPLWNRYKWYTNSISNESINSSFKTWSYEIRYLFYTIFLGCLFTFLQLFEYVNCSYSIFDSIYGSISFSTTGFHGLHVIVGTLFLIVCLVRSRLLHFNKKQHLWFLCAAYYWHFVDVAWIFLFIFLYVWSSQ